MKDNLRYFLAGISALIAILPLLITFLRKTEAEKEKEEQFLEFARDLVEAVKAGTPISKAIMQVSRKNYGSLTKHIKKLANQIALGIPVKKAFTIFALDIGNPVISRSIELIREAEESGGEIGSILEQVALSVQEIETLKKERKAAMFNLIIEGYVIFLVFVVIMLMLQLKFIPMLAGFGIKQGGSPSFGGFGAKIELIAPEFLQKIFFAMLLIQGFFAGLVIGALSEGKVLSGLKHSAALVAIAYLITTGVRVFT